MKKVVIIILFGISIISFNACSQVEPIVQDVCTITTEICNYAEILCNSFNPNVLTKSETEELKKELIEIRKILEAKVSEINKRAEIKKNKKDNLFYLVERMKILSDEINEKINLAEN